MSYIQKSITERIFLRKVYEEIKKNSPNFDFKIYMTDETGSDIYDARLIKFEKNTCNIIQNYYLEAKIRDDDWGDLMLEKIKWNNLKSLVKKMDFKTNKDCFLNIKSDIIYISVTPSGTWWWNLSKMDIDNCQWEVKNCPVSTVDQSKGRVDKDVFMLDKSDGKFFNIKSTDKNNVDEIQIKRTLLNHKRTRCIFEGII